MAWKTIRPPAAPISWRPVGGTEAGGARELNGRVPGDPEGAAGGAVGAPDLPRRTGREDDPAARERSEAHVLVELEVTPVALSRADVGERGGGLRRAGAGEELVELAVVPGQEDH